VEGLEHGADGRQDDDAQQLHGFVKAGRFPADTWRVELKVSRPIQILVLVLVVAGVGGIASMSMMGKSTPAASGPQEPVTPVHRTATVAPATPSTPKAPVHKAVPVAKPAKPKAPKPTVAKNGLPIVLADALRDHRIVVVSVFDPQDQTDAISYAEARAGAGDARAGFLGVSVLDDTVASPLTAALPGGGLLPVPGLLVYRAPGVLVQRIDGFADRDAVAQIAVAARVGEPLTAPVATNPVPTAAAPVPTPAPAAP
jgi:hypothetical protein